MNDTKYLRKLLELALNKLADTRGLIQEGTWHNPDKEWEEDLDALINAICVEFDTEKKP